MTDDRRGPLVVGAFTVVMGALRFLAAGNVIPQPDTAFGAPRWLVALFGLGFFLCGWYAISLALPTPRMRQVLGRDRPRGVDRRAEMARAPAPALTLRAARCYNPTVVPGCLP